MSQPEVLPVEESAEGWRGQLTEDVAAAQAADDLVASGRGGPRLHYEARQLLRDLARPHRRAIAWVLAVVVVQTAATMAGPWLIGVAIDSALPDAIDGDYRPAVALTVGLVIAALLSGGLRAVFVRRSGRIGQAVLLDLRHRLFDHTQALSVSFHERFTSGRVISRLTSDIDALNELLDEGLDGLLTAMFNIAAITSFVETLNGIRAVQAFRREGRNDQLFGALNQSYRRANADSFKLFAVFMPATTLIGNVAAVVVLVVGGYRVADGGLALGVLTSFLLYLWQFYDPMEDVAVFYNSLQSATAALEKIAAVLPLRTRAKAIRAPSGE